MSQLILGLYMIVDGVTSGCEFVTKCHLQTHADFDISATPITPIPLPLYMMCSFGGSWSVDIAFPTMSLVYGTKPLLPFIWEKYTLIIPQTF
jgi:hypothetical protein